MVDGFDADGEEELAMSWFYVDDQFDDCPKLAELPPELELACIGLWTKAGSWSRRKLTGGQIPRGQVRKLGGTEELAEALVKAGLWESRGAGYAFHDWEEWQETPAEVEAKRERWKRQKQAQRAARLEKRGLAPSGEASTADNQADSGETTGVVHRGRAVEQTGRFVHGGQPSGHSVESAARPPAVHPPVPGIPNSQFPSPNSQIPEPTPQASPADAGVRACEDAWALEAVHEERVSFDAAVRRRFVKLHLEANLGDPSMGGRKVGLFPDRLRNTATSLHEDPLELLERAFKLWLEGGCDGADKASPYAAFVERFTRLVAPPKPGARTKGFMRSSTPEQFKGGVSGRAVFGGGVR